MSIRYSRLHKLRVFLHGHGAKVPRNREGATATFFQQSRFKIEWIYKTVQERDRNAANYLHSRGESYDLGNEDFVE